MKPSIEITAALRLILTIVILTTSVLVVGQEIAAAERWFGIELPPEFVPHESPITSSEHEPAPAVVAVGEEAYRELEGARLADGLEQLVAFSKQSRTNRELGGDQPWDRISGFSSGESVIRWTAEQLQTGTR